MLKDNTLSYCRRCLKQLHYVHLEKSAYDGNTLVCEDCREVELKEISTKLKYKGVPYWNRNIKHIYG